MPVQSAMTRDPPGPDRRPAPATIARVPAAAHPGQLLQRKLGNQGAAQLARSVVGGSGLQRSSLAVSSPHDPAEREATRVAAQVMRLPAPAAVAPVRAGVQRAEIARATAPSGAPRPPTGVPAGVAQEIAGSASSGQPLPTGVRSFMEPRFGANFGGVRIHTGERAGRLSSQVSARAFTVGNQIFFGRGSFRPDTQDGRELIAHELTHTIQQGAAVQRSPEVSVSPSDPSVQRTAEVNERAAPQVQRWPGRGTVLDFFADAAHAIPGFRMFTIILGLNPLNGRPVERTAANVLRAVIEFMPLGHLITQALDKYGVFDKVGSWVSDQIDTLSITGRAIRNAVTSFLDSLGWSDFVHPGDAWDRAVRIFTDPIDRIKSFIGDLVSGVIGFIKDAILRPLAQLVKGTRGYDLLCAILARDPITGDPVPRTAATLIGGFMRLIGQEEVWQNIQKGNAVGRAWTWFQNALASLMGFVRQIPKLFLDLLTSLTIQDLVLLPRVFDKVVTTFGDFAGRFVTWAGNAVWNLLEIIFSVVAPGVMPYLLKARAAFRTILKNPIGFVRNLVRAGILGLRQFASHFLTHLRGALIGWLTGALGGSNIYIPQSLAPRELIKFVLSVLGLTWQNMRSKLVRRLGEPTVRALEATFDIVKVLVRQGPAAAWEKIQENLTNLRQLVIEEVLKFVRDRIVQAAITRLVTSLNPAGAFIQAIIAIYNTIMFFVERMRQIAQVAASVIDSLSAIAAGAIATAANRVEKTMAGLLTLVISFLARLVGLGKVSDAVTNVIRRVRQPIDRALDRVVDWIVAQARRLGKAVAGRPGSPATPAGTAGPADGELGETVRFSAGGEGHRLWVDVRGENAQIMLASTPKPLSDHLAEFREMARDLEDGPPKTQLLSRIAVALRLARAMETDARRAASRRIDTPERDSLDQRIEANEQLLRPELVAILDELGLRPPTRVTPEVPVRFTLRPGLNQVEYRRQLSMQETAINEMVVEDWFRNRDRYTERSRVGRSGRHRSSEREQRNLKALYRAAAIERLTGGVNATGDSVAFTDQYLSAFVGSVFGKYPVATRMQGLSEADATREVDDWMKTQNALHSPDQVVGGSHDDLTGLGSGGVNSDIGANWGKWGDKPAHLANRLDRDTRAALGRMTNVRRSLWRVIKMHVRLYF
jgi:hypothetical protein